MDNSGQRFPVIVVGLLLSAGAFFPAVAGQTGRTCEDAFEDFRSHPPTDDATTYILAIEEALGVSCGFSIFESVRPSPHAPETIGSTSAIATCPGGGGAGAIRIIVYADPVTSPIEQSFIAAGHIGPSANPSIIATSLAMEFAGDRLVAALVVGGVPIPLLDPWAGVACGEITSEVCVKGICGEVKSPIACSGAAGGALIAQGQFGISVESELSGAGCDTSLALNVLDGPLPVLQSP